MFKKMMKHLANNPSLKILSIGIAVILWLVVVNYDNPEITKAYNIAVEILGEETLASWEQVYQVVDDNRTAAIRVTGKRKLLESLNGSDFRATADLSQVDFEEDGDVKAVPIRITMPKRYEDVLSYSQDTKNLLITLEDLATEQSVVTGTTSGTPAEGYAIGDVKVSPNLISLSGPLSEVEKVSRIVANVNVNGLTEDVTMSVTPILQDENGKVIEDSRIKLSQDEVTVSVQILGTKTVTVECATTGDPMDGYLFTGLEYAPDTVEIKGESEVLNNIHSIRIPGEAINLQGATGDVENTIDITPYLEEGVSLVNPEENKIAVKALVERLEVKNLDLPVDKLEELNIQEGYEAIYNTSVIVIPVRGRSVELENLTEADIRASIDLNNLEPGMHRVTVDIILDVRYQVVGTVTIQVTIQEIGADNGEGGTGDGTGNQGGTDDGGTNTGGAGNGAGNGDGGPDGTGSGDVTETGAQ